MWLQARRVGLVFRVARQSQRREHRAETFLIKAEAGGKGCGEQWITDLLPRFTLSKKVSASVGLKRLRVRSPKMTAIPSRADTGGAGVLA